MQNLQNNPPTFNLLMEQALSASQNNDSETALRLFSEASTQLPQSALPHFMSAAELAQLGRMNEAEAAYANAVLLAPEFEIARYQLGLVQFTSGRAAMALVTWQPLLEQSTGSPLTLFTRGFAALAQDDFHNALSLFTQGMEANHTNAPLNGDIARVIAEIRKITEPENNASPDNETSVDAEASHFLLGSYRQQNPLN